MTNYKNNFFTQTPSIKNDILSEYSLELLGLFVKQVQEHLGRDNISSISHIMEIASKEVDNGQELFESLRSKVDEGDISQGSFPYYNNNYTLLSCIHDEMTLGSPFGISSLYGLLEYDFYDDVFSSGYSFIWRSVGITNEEVKKTVVKDFVEHLVQDIEVDDDSFDKVILDRLINGIMASEEDSDHSESDPHFLKKGEGFKRRTLIELMDKSACFQEHVGFFDIPDNYVLFTWIAPLCHKAYMDGMDSSDIMSGVMPIIEELANIYQIKESRERKEFCRRCLAHIAMGFSGLMKEIGFTKSDLSTLDFNESLKASCGLIVNSPLLFRSQSDADIVSTLYNDLALLEDLGISIDTDFIMELEASKSIGASLLNPYSTLYPASLLEATRNPLWDELVDINICYSSEPLPIEIIAAVLRREEHVRKKVPMKEYFTRDEQEFILKDLIKHNKLNKQVIDQIKAPGDLLMKYRKDLPSKLRKYSLEIDLGL